MIALFPNHVKDTVRSHVKYTRAPPGDHVPLGDLLPSQAWLGSSKAPGSREGEGRCATGPQRSGTSAHVQTAQASGRTAPSVCPGRGGVGATPSSLTDGRTHQSERRRGGGAGPCCEPAPGSRWSCGR